MTVTRDVRKLSVLLPKEVHLRLKRSAVLNDKTITDIVTDLIDGYLAKPD